MSIRAIMMPVGGASEDRSELSAGITVAQLLASHLEAVYVRPDPYKSLVHLGLLETDRDAAIQDMRARMDERGKAEADRFRRSFSALCRKAGVPKIRHPEAAQAATARWRTLKGYACEVIPALARGADLSLFTASPAHYNLLSENLLEITLLCSGRPVLFVPAGCEIRAFRRAVVAWDRSSGCARAVSAWLDMADEAATATILQVHEQPGGELPDTSEVVAHLGWHGVAAGERTVRPGSDSVGEILLDSAGPASADILVMGGYGHARYLEALLGGVTRHVLRYARIPVLMSH